MIQYRYNRQVLPPAPFVYVELRRPESKSMPVQAPAQIDTGADRTSIPASIVDALDLRTIRETVVLGYGNIPHEVRTVDVEVGFHGGAAMTLEVYCSPDEECVLLGRDWLNRFKVVLDGPMLSLEIHT